LVQSQHLPTQWNLETDETVLNIGHKKIKIQKNPPLYIMVQKIESNHNQVASDSSRE
jgi:hypothetical protein